MKVEEVTGLREDRFTDLVRSVADPIRAYLARRTDATTAEEVLADTLTVLWRRLDDVPLDGAVPWSIGVARLQLRNSERAARRRGRLVARIVDLHDATEHSGPPGSEEELASVIAVRRALGAMRSADAELLRLWVWEGLGSSGIATVLGITPNAAAIRLHRARRRFAALYEGDDAARVQQEGNGR